MGEKRNDYVQKLKKNIDRWNVEIGEFQARADSARSDLKVKYRNQMEDLKTRRQDLEAKVSELHQAGEAAWEDVTAGVDAARDALVESILAARSRFDL